MSRIPLRVSTLVTPKWLSSKLQARPDNFKVLDATWHLPISKRNARKEFNEGHIPTAQFFDIDECCDKTSPYDHMLPSENIFEDFVGKLGINNSMHVVIYDRNETYGLFSAQRVWWTFRVFGHNLVSILDGGLPRWVKEGYDITEEVEKVQPQVFRATMNKRMVVSFEEMEKNVDEQRFHVIDARAKGRFDGTAPEPRPDIKPGHIPNSTSIPFTSLLDPETKVMKTPEQIKQVFEEAGVDPAQPAVASCGSGITACMLVLGSHLLGNDDIAVYDGAWTEWYKRARHEHKVGTPV